MPSSPRTPAAVQGTGRLRRGKEFLTQRRGAAEDSGWERCRGEAGRLVELPAGGVGWFVAGVPGDAGG